MENQEKEIMKEGKPSCMKKGYIACYIFIIAVVFLIITIFPKWIVDDAYITFRYADNLVQHGELTFNAREDPVEGYTGILLPLSIALAMNFGISPELAAHLIGVISFFVVLIVFHQFLLRLHVSVVLRLASLLLLATAAFLYTHVFSGLETLLFTALLMISSLQLHSLINTRTCSCLRYILLSLSLLALSLCRPEGAAYTLIAVCVVTCFFAFRLKSLQPLIVFLLFLVMPGLLYFIWRWNYYGFLLPNTFYAKLSDSLSASTFESLLSFGKQYLLFPMLVVVVTYLFSLNKIKILLKQKMGGYLTTGNVLTFGSFILFTAIVLIQYLHSDLAMNYSYRFYAPFYPLLILVIVWILSPGIEAILAGSGIKSLKNIILLLVLCMLLLTQVFYQLKWLVQKEIPYSSEYKTRLSEMHCNAGKYLKQRVPSSEWLVIHIDAGAIPYYSGLRTIDFGGLNDEYLAHNKTASLKDRLDYFFSRKPGAVVFTTYDWTHVNHGEEADAIIADPRFREYALVKKYRNSCGKKYFEFVFLRRDLLHKDEEVGITKQENQEKAEQRVYHSFKMGGE